MNRNMKELQQVTYKEHLSDISFNLKTNWKSHFPPMLLHIVPDQKEQHQSRAQLVGQLLGLLRGAIELRVFWRPQIATYKHCSEL